MAGTTFDIVVLSSSPPDSSAGPHHINGYPPRRDALPAALSQSFFPPLSPTRPVFGASKVIPGASIKPDSTVRGFATVGSLVQSECFVYPPGEGSAQTIPVQLQGASHESIVAETAPTKKPRKPRTAAHATADGIERPNPNPRARKPKADRDVSTTDPELRFPASKKSPFFQDTLAELSTNSATGVATEVAPTLTKSGKPRKPRTKKDKVDEKDVGPVRKKPERTKVATTKPAARNKKAHEEIAAVTSAHFQDAPSQSRPIKATNTDVTILKAEDHQEPTRDDISTRDVPQSPQPKKKAAPKKSRSIPVAEGLYLEEAVTRRQNWTPPRDTTVPSPSTTSVGKENKQSTPKNEGTFTNLLSNFTYAQSPSVPTNIAAANIDRESIAMTKRRRIELMDIPGHQTNSRNSSPEKGKAPKKKPRTITDIVTEQYAPKNLAPDTDVSSHDFFDIGSKAVNIPLNDLSASNVELNPKKPPRRRKNSKSDPGQAATKAVTKKTSKKPTGKSKPVAEKLLSPTSALSRLVQQDVLFGTSSQLALEESPTTVRHLQHAIRESERDAGICNDLVSAAPSRWLKLEKTIGTRGLWEESARDADGGILEHMEDVYIPEPDRTQDIPMLMDGAHDEPDVSMSFIDIDDIASPPQSAQNTALPTLHSTNTHASGHIKRPDVDYPMIEEVLEKMGNVAQKPPPSNQNDDSQHSFADIDDFDPPPAAQKPARTAPKLDPSTVKSIDDPPKKRRGRPPKSESSTSSIAPPRSSSLQPSTSQARQKQKARQLPSTPPSATPRFIDIEEILDSEDETLESFSPTPPRIHKFANLPPLPLASFDGSPAKQNTTPPDPTLPRVHCIPATHLNWATIKSTIFTRLTQHIRSIPPTRDPKHPSWHEKILLFDPIVLEDFTAYVNDNTDVRTWRRATQKQIKAWNADAKKRGNAGVATSPDANEVLAVEKEMEGWMVKAWCESLSVCCINRIRSNGRARKGLY